MMFSYPSDRTVFTEGPLGSEGTNVVMCLLHLSGMGRWTEAKAQENRSGIQHIWVYSIRRQHVRPDFARVGGRRSQIKGA